MVLIYNNLTRSSKTDHNNQSPTHHKATEQAESTHKLKAIYL